MFSCIIKRIENERNPPPPIPPLIPLCFKLMTHQFWAQVLFFVTCFVINNIRLIWWAPGAIFYHSYFRRYEHKLPNISLFSEICDYIHFSLANCLTFYRYSLPWFLVVTKPLHSSSPLSPPNLTDVTAVSRATPGVPQLSQNCLSALIRK